MAFTITGTIAKTQKCKNHTYLYWIKDTDGNTNKYVYFDKGGKGLDSMHEITITFKKVHNKFGESNIIDGVNYGNFITDLTMIKDLLINQIGLSKTFTDRIMKKYGENTWNILLANDLTMFYQIEHRFIEKEVKKIEEFRTKNQQFQFYIALTELGIKSKYQDIISHTLGQDINAIRGSIYDLYHSCDVPFKECDAIALKLGYDPNGPSRIEAFIDMLFKQLNNIGILYLTRDDLEQKCLEYDIIIDNVIGELKEVTIEYNIYYTIEKNYQKEKKVEELCMYLLCRKSTSKMIYDKDYYVLETGLVIQQYEAIRNAIKYNISIITGSPGTGKSYTISHIVYEFYKHSLVYILAPTGAAVEKIRGEKLLQEWKKPKIQTIHSFLYSQYDRNLIDDSEDYSEQDDSEDSDSKGTYKTAIDYIYEVSNTYKECVFLIDEMSMVDLDLFHKFLVTIEKIKTKIRLVLLGDKNQLPSIKGGFILNDLIQSRRFPVTVLEKNYRQKENTIIINAERVLCGKNIKYDGKSVKFIKAETLDEIAKKLNDTITENHISYKNSCVLIPQKRRGICTNYINIVLQNIYNPKQKDIVHNFRIGDKLIHLTNNKNKGIYNGSILIVDRFKFKSKDETDDRISKMICRYYRDETNLSNKKYRYVRFKTSELPDLDLAYAMTIHKAQGKGYPCVIIILHSSMYSKMLNRNLLYTAITRAQEKCIIIGDIEGLTECQKIMEPRITNLFKPEQNLLVDILTFIYDSLLPTSNPKIRTKIIKYLTSLGLDPKIISDVSSKKVIKELNKLFGILCQNTQYIRKLYMIYHREFVKIKTNIKPMEIIEI